MTGSELKALRESINLTQTELAHVLRVSGAAVSRWEDGKRRIDGPTSIAVEHLVGRRLRAVSGKKKGGKPDFGDWLVETAQVARRLEDRLDVLIKYKRDWQGRYASTLEGAFLRHALMAVAERTQNAMALPKPRTSRHRKTGSADNNPLKPRLRA